MLYYKRKRKRTRRGGKSKRALNEALFNEANGLCGICNKPVASNDLSLDHIIPTGRGGCNHKFNLRIAHKECNELRDDVLDLSDPIQAYVWRKHLELGLLKPVDRR